MKVETVTLVRRDPEANNVYSAFSHPGLALPIVGTALQEAGYRVRIYVDVIEPASWEELAGSDVVGLTVNSACSRESYRLADRLKRETDCVVVFGGPHVTFLPDEALEHGDFVVRGEGESSIVELVRALERGRTDFGCVAGLSWRDAGGRVRHNPDRSLEADIDRVPDQSLVVGLRRFTRRFTERFFPTGMLVSTSRGCPFRCTFCTIPRTFGQVVRFRSPDAVVADIRQQTALSGHRYIYFADDNFTAHPTRTKKLLRRLVDERLDLRFSAQVRADVTRDAELTDLLRAAGCYLVFVGFESINEPTLKAYRKGLASRAFLEQAIREFHRRGILVHAMFVIGADEDPSGTAFRTAEWARDQGVASLQMLPLCPLPGTEVLAQLEAAGRLYKSWDVERERAYLPYAAGSLVLFEPRQTSAVELQEELSRGYWRFYSWAGVLGSVLKMRRGGINPLVFRLMGRRLLRRAESQVQEHLRWLEQRAPSRPGAAPRAVTEAA